MTAKEMFECLGFTYYEDDNIISYTDENAGGFTFDKFYKSVSLSVPIEGKKFVVTYSFLLEEIKALQTQVEELGWDNYWSLKCTKTKYISGNIKDIMLK